MIETTETLLLSLGEQLKKGRESLALSIEEVAQKTNLKKSHIESFENDIFILQNVPPAFVRGYVRNYVRFLRLPEALIQQANYGEVNIPKEVKKAAPIQVSNNHKSQKRWVKILTWLILLCAVGMTLAWWWQEHQKDEMSRAEMVGSSTVVLSTSTDSLQSAESNTTESSSAASATAQENSVALSLTPENNPSQVGTAVASPAVATENVTVESNAVTPAVTAPLNAETAVVTSPTLDNTSAVVEAPKATETTETATNSSGVLRIEITQGQSWITVRGTKNKRSLAEKLYVAGDVLTFDDAEEQYRVTIGAPAYVKLYYKGEQIPMKMDGRVARLKFPQ